eukprot:1304293-Karenia_brevis.AAC.1
MVMMVMMMMMIFTWSEACSLVKAAGLEKQIKNQRARRGNLAANLGPSLSCNPGCGSSLANFSAASPSV